ncbi:MAG: hypothetical protein KAV00_01000 [Phycisphaerae bacterium]|nr:hypothetical protein [Phycisphaerae bacterium]
MDYAKNQANPVFLVPLVDQYGAPATGIVAPDVHVVTGQGATATVVAWVEDTDFTWQELTSGEATKGVYRLRQMDSPNVDAVATEGACWLSAHKTLHDIAAGAVAYQVVDRASTGSVPAAIADAVADELLSGHTTDGSLAALLTRLVEVLTTKRDLDLTTGVQTLYNVAGDTARYTVTPSTPDPDIARETVEVVP